MISIAICDDDLVFASGIETLVIRTARERCTEVSTDVYSDGNDLWKGIAAGSKYDIIYLDIEMDCLNGIDVAKKIREKDNNVILIYVSSYENYFIDLFEVEPFRFIKKPIDVGIFKNYFVKACERVMQSDAYFEYQFNKVLCRELLKNIIFFESMGRTIFIHSTDGTATFYGKLNQVEKQLSESRIPFLRIHQSYLVNHRYIKNISFSCLTLAGGVKLQISEGRQRAIRSKYNELMREEFLHD
ncbi:MAG: response regulator transcription factor [Lachnospiraceae bacterium]|jgi:DNA-binding LytR/AlgR family response regulator|nr:response regulator transcription factor [Lachnospiraceae bacterium]